MYYYLLFSSKFPDELRELIDHGGIVCDTEKLVNYLIKFGAHSFEDFKELSFEDLKEENTGKSNAMIL